MFSTVSEMECLTLSQRPQGRIQWYERFDRITGDPRLIQLATAFETLGSKGWNWDSMLEYFKKVRRDYYCPPLTPNDDNR